MLKIIPIQTGMSHVFLIKHDDGAFLVDTGKSGYGNKIIRAIKSRGTDLKELKFIFITHAHYDHAGNAAFLAKKTGAPVIIHQSEARYLQQGSKPLPGGTNPFFKLLVSAGKRMGSKFSGFEPVIPTVTFTEQLDLSPMFGIEAQIIHTPGHPLGSSSLLIGENLFVGDTAFNIWMNTIYPLFADNEPQLHQTWRRLLKMDVDMIYPAHGKRFSMEKFKAAAIRKGIVS